MSVKGNMNNDRRGKVIPVVNFNRCEGKNCCVKACPYDVFDVRKIEKKDYQDLSLMGKFKNRIHGGLVAYTPKADQCRGCGLCVKACPERAIKIVKANPQNQ
jgi:NAD-dependent dihydropyrimidine dehydrogenase PreA subunit